MSGFAAASALTSGALVAPALSALARMLRRDMIRKVQSAGARSVWSILPASWTSAVDRALAASGVHTD